MQKTFFFAILGMLSLIPLSAYAEVEHGINYDRQLIETKPDGTQIYQWTSTPYSAERILSSDGTYKNYIIRQDSGNIYFESAQGSVSFNKSSCALSTYDAGRIDSPPDFILSHTIKQAVNGTDNWVAAPENTEACTYGLVEKEFSAQITAKRGDFSVIYDIDFNHGFEWTYHYTNTNTNDADKKVGFTLVCDGQKCGDVKLDGFEINQGMVTKEQLENKTITVNDQEFDPKDYVHGALWALKEQPDKLIVDFTDAKQPVGLGESITVDPTFGYSAAQSQQTIISGPSAGVSCGAGTSNNTAAAGTYSSYLASTVNDNCILQVGKFIITSIPDTATIVSANFRHDRGALGGSTGEIKLVSHNMTSDPQGAASAATKWVQATGGNFIISPWTESAANTNDIVRPFNSNGTTYIQNQLTANWMGFSVTSVSQKRDGSAHIIQNIQNWELQVTYTAAPPDPVTTLAASGTTTTTTDLSWSAPNMNGGTLQRYVINYTSPCGTPNTHLANGTTATSYTVSGLTLDTCYSFRVSAATEAGYNISGANIVNVTTLAFNQANYTIGSFNFNANNPTVFPIRYERIDSGANTRINVTFASTINLACDLRYTYAGTNHTYHTISSIPISGTEREASFLFTNSSKDITTFRCWNQSGNQSANYVLTQTDFLLKQQVRDFRNGTYGTMGQFGAFDLITLIVVIISMIGLNRNTEAVAGIFCIVAISVLAYFGIVSWVTAIVSAACVILLFIVAGTRKT